MMILTISPHFRPQAEQNGPTHLLLYLELRHAAPVLSDAPDGAGVAHPRVREQHRVEPRFVHHHLGGGILI